MDLLTWIILLPAHVVIAVAAGWGVVAGAITLFTLRWATRLPPATGCHVQAPLDAYAWAYLAGEASRAGRGGRERVVEAASAVLLLQGAVAVSSRDNSVGIAGDLPANSSPIEKAVYDLVNTRGQANKAHAQQASRTLEALITSVSNDLRADGYLVPEARALAARWTMGIAWGLAAIATGILTAILHRSNDFHEQVRPATTLWVLVFAAYFVLTMACTQFSFPPSEQGKRSVADARARHARLCPAPGGSAPQLNLSEVVLSVGLFGLEAWSTRPLVELRSALDPPGSGPAG